MARAVADIIAGFGIIGPDNEGALRSALNRYADALDGWARSVARRMLADVAARDERAWMAASREMGAEIGRIVKSTPIGEAMQAKMAEQVGLIKSLPREAAERVHRLVIEGQETGVRADVIAREIMRTGEVTRSRANLIARTEIGRAASTLTQVRAEAVGSVGYIWRTSRDSDVRPSHKRMEGRFVAWADPPELDGLTGHAGALPNCFVGSTRVHLGNGCHHVWRTLYSGRIISLSVGGCLVEATPNHPLLTLRGWVPAHAINEGDYLVQSAAQSFDRVDDDEDHAYPTIEEVFLTISSFVEPECHSGQAFDFHGDVPDQDVDAVRSDHLLPGGFVSDGVKGFRDLSLSRTNRVVLNARVEGGRFHVGKASLSGFGNKLTTSVSSHSGHPQAIGLAGRTDGNSLSNQGISDRLSGATQREGDSGLAFSGKVAGNDLVDRKSKSVHSRWDNTRDYDPTSAQLLAEVVRMQADLGCSVFDSGAGSYKVLRVVNKAERDFLGHVYTMETANGWFAVTSAGIVAKNCRCYSEPVIPDPDA